MRTEWSLLIKMAKKRFVAAWSWLLHQIAERLHLCMVSSDQKRKEEKTEEAPPPSPPPTTTTEVDWSNLPVDVLENIANRLSLLEYITFGAVCKQWRCVASRDRAPHLPNADGPRPWVVLDGGRAEATRSLWFVSLTSQRFYGLSLPVPSLVCGCSRGWLMLSDASGRRSYLLDSFSGAYLLLPPLHLDGPTVVLSSPSVAKTGCTAFAVGSCGRRCAIFRIKAQEKEAQGEGGGGRPWHYFMVSEERRIEDAVFFNGRCYFVTFSGWIGSFADYGRWGSDWTMYMCVNVAGKRYGKYLVDRNGELVLVYTEVYGDAGDVGGGERVKFCSILIPKSLMRQEGGDQEEGGGVERSRLLLLRHFSSVCVDMEEEEEGEEEVSGREYAFHFGDSFIDGYDYKDGTYSHLLRYHVKAGKAWPLPLSSALA